MTKAKSAVRSSRPRPQLDREVIVEAGLKLAALGASDGISFRKLGEELGADPTAIYRHFRSKEELMHALLDRLLAVTAEQVSPELGWRQRLRDNAARTLDILVAHPSVGIEAGTRSTGGPAERDMVELILAALTEAGISGPDIVKFYSVFAGYCLAFASASAAGQLIEDESFDNDEFWVPDLGRIDSERHPNIAIHAKKLMELRDRDVFLAGADVILDAIETAAHKA